MKRLIGLFAIPAVLLSAGLGSRLITGAVANEKEALVSLPERIDFNRDIRPILSDNCFQCHGPDQSQRKAKLRLDLGAEALADRGGYHVLVPQKLDASVLWKRVRAKRKPMPPKRSGKKLTKRQIGLIRRWIEQGAQYQKHWSLIAPKRPPLPKIKNERWPKNGIDRFVLARLEQEGLKPSPQADRRTLIRRVTLDLTGLPPTLNEVEDFVNDRSPKAYDNLVARLLAHPRYGEHMALPWLDAARYADTNGYQADGERQMWRWRDWVIDAFNKNMPFDKFTIEQLAGDLLPNPTLDQLIATGFNRNHRGNAEGGIIPEEYLAEYAVDRVDTTATVWLGLTAGCARCHDHKYDPITQKEFYQLFAYFNNLHEKGKVVRFGNSPPFIKAPTPNQQKKMQALSARIVRAERRCQSVETELLRGLKNWEASVEGKREINWTFTDGLRTHFALDAETPKKSSPVFKDGEARFAFGKVHKAAAFEGESYMDAGDVGELSFYDRFTFGAWIYPADVMSGTIFSRMKDTDRAEGYSLVLDRGAVQLNLVRRWLDDSIRLQTKIKLKPGKWYHVMATYDGSRVAKGVTIYIDGKPQPLQINLDDLNQDFKVDAPFRIGSGGGKKNRFRGRIDEVRIYDRVLSPAEIGIVCESTAISNIVSLARAKRSKPQTDKLRFFYLNRHADKRIQKAHQLLKKLQQERIELDDSLPTVMVMRERKKRHPTHVLIRGEYDKKGERVERGVPASLPALPKNARDDRLGLAKWLVSPENPLTSRVAVNRFWQRYFGMGLVKTTEDFGSQGEWPSHPQLLDWLAVEFRESGWDVKALLNLIVTSATYRQSSRVTPKKLKKDPGNRLLARGPRVRLSAHAVRDQALYVSGLLVEKRGGPSVKPYQPKGLWKELSGKEYVRDKGENLYRRSLYIYWKRTIPAPAMMTFDAANREACIVRQTRTNTPLQALNLMNDVAFVEASRMLAQRAIKNGGKTAAERLRFAFALVTARNPRPAELQILLDGLDAHRQGYTKDRDAALKLVIQGDHPRDKNLNIPELAAYTAVASVILNLDEAIMKQ